ncbi:caprin-2 isoform X2 [Pungitius pungitius]|uniref:caprin-2 isoform X2 n=1 Tax=Pungitius pungitius TaxID=134920 RepID=UPI002E125B51
MAPWPSRLNAPAAKGSIPFRTLELPQRIQRARGKDRVEIDMVQISTPTRSVTPQSECSESQENLVMAERPELCSPGALSALQRSLETSTVYYGYDTYIEDGLLCLKHKIRNLEKKKLKLEDYRKRLDFGEELNHDQTEAVKKYEEVVHNLVFARELHMSLNALTQNLLVAQKKAVRKEQVLKEQTERRHLSTVLQIQHLLHCMQQEHVRRDLLSGSNQAPHIAAQQLRSLSLLAALLGVKRNNGLSLEEQMEQAATAYLDLLEGKDKPVAGSTFKLFKEELTRLSNCKYFSCLPHPPMKSPEVVLKSHDNSTPSKSKLKGSKESWNEDFQTTIEREPPDSWDIEVADAPGSAHAAVYKPWRGAATFIPKVPVAAKEQSIDSKQTKKTGAKSKRRAKSAVHKGMPVEVFSYPYALPKDPVLRKQHLEDLMTTIHGSFSFMQDSLLDGDIPAANDYPRVKRQQSRSPLPLGHTVLRSPVNVLPKAMHSTPLPIKLLERKASLTNEDPFLEVCDPSSTDLPHIAVAESNKKSPRNGMISCTSTPSKRQSFSTPPARRTVTSSHIQPAIRCTASTQTPPEFLTSEEEPLFVYQSDYAVGNGGPIFLSPGQSDGSGGRPSQLYYSRGSVRGSCTSQTDPCYAARDSGCQQGFSREGGRHNLSAWSDSSQMSPPNREGAFTIVDSGHGDSLSVSTIEVPLTPHGHQHTLLPIQLHPLSQPLRVAFNASRTVNFAPGNLDQPIVFDQLHTNLGEMYDTHIGRFTCPVDGTYVFIFHILKLAINVPLYINLMRNEEVMVSAYANDGAPDHETASNHAILPLFQGDQVWLRLHRGAIYGSTWKYSTFSGFLLYQD